MMDEKSRIEILEEALETILTSYWDDPEVAVREIRRIARTALTEEDEPDATLTAAGWGFY